MSDVTVHYLDYLPVTIDTGIKLNIANVNVGVFPNKRAARRKDNEKQQGQKELCFSVDESQ